METITVKYHKTVFEKEDYLIGLYLCIDGSTKRFITCKGYGLPKNNNTFYRFNGEFVVERGKQVFKVSTTEMVVAKNKAGLTSFFKSDEFDGIGAKTISNIIDKYGQDIFDVIQNNPNDILSVKGMNEEKLKILVNGYNDKVSVSILTKHLSPMGINYRQIKLISNAYGSEAMEIIKENPFELMDISGIGFRTCDTIARYFGSALNSVERIRGGIMETIHSISNGDTYTLDKEVIDLSLAKLNDGLEDNPVKRDDVIKGIMSLIQNREICIEERHKLFSHSYWKAEERTAIKITNMLKRKDIDVSSLERVLDGDIHNLQGLSNEQLDALKMALSNHVSIITGGAGTGKTTVIKAIIRTFQKLYPRRKITLLAPTGKASRRISEVVGLQAHTIHSTLGLYEGIEEPTNYISDGLVIVDEISMADTMLLSHLIRAINGNCQVAFFGDINQLPSVSAGACLRDMIESGVVPTTRLTKIFRQQGESTIIDDSLKIIDGNNSLEYDDNIMLVSTRGENHAIEQIKKIYSYYVGKVGIENVALISPLRSTQDGRFKCVSDQLNNIIQETINPETNSIYKSGVVSYKLNDRVMMWKNTPTASNGDVGTIVKLTTNTDWGLEMTVEWENGNTGVYHKSDLDKITLAYSMSVHKSQGSEYDTVIVPVLSEHRCKLFKNNLLYTAITRAKKRVILVGDKDAINYMIAHSDTYKRKTFFKERLQKYASGDFHGFEDC